MKNKSSENGPLAVSKAYDFVLWLVQKVETFPRSRSKFMDMIRVGSRTKPYHPLDGRGWSCFPGGFR